MEEREHFFIFLNKKIGGCYIRTQSFSKVQVGFVAYQSKSKTSSFFITGFIEVLMLS